MDVADTSLENFIRRHAAAARFAGIDDIEQTDHELRGLSRRLCFLLRFHTARIGFRYEREARNGKQRREQDNRPPTPSIPDQASVTNAEGHAGGVRRARRPACQAMILSFAWLFPSPPSRTSAAIGSAGPSETSAGGKEHIEFLEKHALLCVRFPSMIRQ